MTTTLYELNDDEPGDADALPHHHGKLTTMTMTRRHCGGSAIAHVMWCCAWGDDEDSDDEDCTGTMYT